MELSVKNLNVQLGKTPIIKNVSLQVKPQQFVGIIGANGSGKSTLLKSIYKSISPESGAVFLDDLDVLKSSEKKVSQYLGVVGQFNELNFDLTVEQMVILGRTPHKKMLEADTASDYEIVRKALAQTNLTDYAKRTFMSLSGGEKQRVILARTIAQEPQFMILDEPTNHLDIRYQLEILQGVKKLGISVLAALHDLETVINYCDYIYAMKDGEIVAHGEPKELLTEALIETIFDVKCQIYTNPITNKPGFVYHI